MRDNERGKLGMARSETDKIYDGVVRHGYGDINSANYEPRTVHGKHHDLNTWVCWPDPF